MSFENGFPKTQFSIFKMFFQEKIRIGEDEDEGHFPNEEVWRTFSKSMKIEGCFVQDTI